MYIVMKKIFLTIFALVTFCFQVKAYDFSLTCESGQTLYYVVLSAYHREVMIVAPSGNYEGFEKPVGEIIIPDSVPFYMFNCAVVAIDDGAFYKCDSLSGNLVIPQTVRSIGNSAFQKCTGIESVSFPEGLQFIGEQAFDGCSRLAGQLNLPPNLKTLPDGAFRNCSGFSGPLVIPSGIKEIGAEAFKGCKGFNGHFVLPDSLISIGESAFAGCDGYFGQLVLPERLETIGESAFASCTGFSGSLIIPDGVKSIMDYAFVSCTGFDDNLVLSQNLKIIERSAFSGCSGFKGDLVIPSKVSSINYYAFANCSGFDGDLIIESPELKIIQSCAFINCSGFIRLRLHEGLEEIGRDAFNGCLGFTEINFPESLLEIGPNAFQDCSGIRGDLLLPESMTFLGESAFQGCSGFDGVLHIPSKLKVIKGGTFCYCSGLKGSIIVPEDVTLIESYAFQNCSGFDGLLSLPSSLMEMRDYVFSGCSNISEMKLGMFREVTMGINVFSDVPKNIPVHVPCPYSEMYEVSPQWREFTNYQDEYLFDFVVETDYDDKGYVTIVHAPDCDDNMAVLQAVPIGNNVFCYWTNNGAVISVKPELKVTVNGPVHYVAHFSMTGLDEVSEAMVSVYPNPAMGQVSVVAKDASAVELFDLSGRLMKHVESDGETLSLDLSACEAGMYFLRIISKDDEEQCVRKIIKL